jgi:aryl-alcohol dehydrogenase-like predicted oxidoreductase
MNEQQRKAHMKIETSILGRSGIEVSRLGLGGLWLSRDQLSDSRQTISFALEAGINFIDTAPAYGDSEFVLGEVIRDLPDRQLVVSTKLGGRPQPFDPQDESILLRSVEMSLELLGRDYIDIMIIHEPDRKREYDWWSDDLTYEGPVRSLLEKLKDRGVIHAIGVGGTTAHELARICDSGAFDVVLTAFNFNLLWREAELEIFPAARRHNMGVIVGSPLQGGRLAVRRDAEVAAAPWISDARKNQFAELYSLLDDEELEIADVGMRFVYFSEHVHSTLTGVRSEAEIKQNMDIISKGPLPAKVLARLDEIYRLVPFRPTLEPFSLPFGDLSAGHAKFY